MIDKEQILKIAQENNLEYEFVELYAEEIEKIFQKNFCFTEKEIKEHISKIFETQNKDAVEYFFNIFYNFSQLDSSSKNLNATEKMYRNKFAKDVVKKAFELYTIQSKKIKDEFFVALKEAEKLGIDPYRISNKTTFKHLSKDSFLESLKALMEDTYVDTNTMKEFHLFENYEDVKAMFEECSSLACKFNSDAIQNVLELLSNFTYDQKNNVFYGNVNYVNMVRKCKKILTQTTDKLQETMDFLTKYFTDKNDSTSKQELVLKVNQDPTILLLSPNKVFNLEKALISVGLSEEKAKAFCFNKNNLIQINGISQENMSDLKALKVVLHKYLDDENTFEALTRFEFIKTKPIMLDIIFKRAIEEGVFTNLLERPSALAMILGDETNPNSKTREHNNASRERKGSLKPLNEEKVLSAEEKELLQEQLSKVSKKDKEYIEGVIEKLKVKDKSVPKPDDNFGHTGGGHHNSSNNRKRKSRYLNDNLLEAVDKIRTNEVMSDLMKVFSICELCLDNIKGKGYCQKKYDSNEARKNFEREQQLNSQTQNLIDGDALFQPIDDIIHHIMQISFNNIPQSLSTSNEIRKYVFANNFYEIFNSAKKIADQIEKISDSSFQLCKNIYKIWIYQCEANTKLKKQGKVQSEENSFIGDIYSSIFCNEANLKMIVLDMVDELQNILKDHFFDVLDEECLTSLCSVAHNPKPIIVMFKYIEKVTTLLDMEDEALDNEKMIQKLNSRPYLNDILKTDEAIKRRMIQLCFVAMNDKKTGDCALNKRISSDIFDLSSVEYDNEGIYLRFKKGYTFFYPDALDHEEIEKLKISPATEGTKALPKVTMTQNTVVEDIQKLSDKILA